MTQPTYHTSAAIVSSGDEIVIGQSLDTNSRWLAQQLLDRGVVTVEHVTIPDDEEAHVRRLARLAGEVSMIVSTGGLGPTLDDVMRRAVARVMGERLVSDERQVDRISALFERMKRPFTDMQRAQALRPASAECLDNDYGSAPGIFARLPGKTGAPGADLFCLPGPPREMRPMFESDVVPRLRRDPCTTVLTRLLYAVGIGEGDAAARLGVLMDRGRSPLVGITAGVGVLTLRIRYVGPLGEREAEAAVQETARQVEAALKPYVLGRLSGREDEAGIDTLAFSAVTSLCFQRARLFVVESCTGGGLGALIAQVPGASAAFEGGAITYSNGQKVALGVSRALIEAHGSVSREVAVDMSHAGLRAIRETAASESLSDEGERDGFLRPGFARGEVIGRHCLAITGIAGPMGGTAQKPVGTVWIAHAWRVAPPLTGMPSAPRAAGELTTDVRCFRFAGHREDIQARACRAALAMLVFALRDGVAGAPRLLWEVDG